MTRLLHVCQMLNVGAHTDLLLSPFFGWGTREVEVLDNIRKLESVVSGTVLEDISTHFQTPLTWLPVVQSWKIHFLTFLLSLPFGLCSDQWRVGQSSPADFWAWSFSDERTRHYTSFPFLLPPRGPSCLGPLWDSEAANLERRAEEEKSSAPCTNLRRLFSPSLFRGDNVLCFTY